LNAWIRTYLFLYALATLQPILVFQQTFKQQQSLVHSSASLCGSLISTTYLVCPKITKAARTAAPFAFAIVIGRTTSTTIGPVGDSSVAFDHAIHCSGKDLVVAASSTVGPAATPAMA
jgi:hypothetical protein